VAIRLASGAIGNAAYKRNKGSMVTSVAAARKLNSAVSSAKRKQAASMTTQTSHRRGKQQKASAWRAKPAEGGVNSRMAAARRK